MLSIISLISTLETPPPPKKYFVNKLTFSEQHCKSEFIDNYFFSSKIIIIIYLLILYDNCYAILIWGESLCPKRKKNNK